MNRKSICSDNMVQYSLELRGTEVVQDRQNFLLRIFFSTGEKIIFIVKSYGITNFLFMVADAKIAAKVIK